METGLYTGYQDIPRIYTALAEWLGCMIFCILMPRRISGRKFVLAAAAILAVQCGWMTLTEDVPTMLWIPCMLAAMGIMFILLLVVLEASFQMKLYCTLKAFLVAEFMASFEWQLEYYFYGRERTAAWQSIIFIIGVYGLVIFIVYILEKRLHGEDFYVEITRRELGSAIMITLGTFMFSNFSFVYKDTPFSGTFTEDIFNIRTLVDIGGLAILYAYQSLIYEMNREKELSSIHAMLSAQYDTYRNYQESTELLHIKYHDLKHQIAGLRAETDPERRMKWIDSIEEELSSYGLAQQTGNHVLDGILNGKLPVIRNNKIDFTCVADGRLLNFIHVTDICAIFGNTLDNAIENTALVSNPEKRIIHMSVSTRKQFLYIEVRNYCEHEIVMKNGYPVTTKSDAGNHGFGIKSICYSVNKYGGNVHFGVNNQFFEMKILIPLPESELAGKNTGSGIA